MGEPFAFECFEVLLRGVLIHGMELRLILGPAGTKATFDDHDGVDDDDDEVDPWACGYQGNL